MRVNWMGNRQFLFETVALLSFLIDSRLLSNICHSMVVEGLLLSPSTLVVHGHSEMDATRLEYHPINPFQVGFLWQKQRETNHIIKRKHQL